ncbi:MAG: hypothetical protein Q8P41_28265 [Pseudomonadota bacterium]|nr:hypothetical protein [Pseudomonadota bacterium]
MSAPIEVKPLPSRAAPGVQCLQDPLRDALSRDVLQDPLTTPARRASTPVSAWFATNPRPGPPATSAAAPVQRLVHITPAAYLAGIGVAPEAATREQLMEYASIALSDELAYAKDMASEDDHIAALTAGESALRKAKTVEQLVAALDLLVAAINAVPNLPTNAQNRYATTPTAGYAHTGLERGEGGKGRKAPVFWGSDAAMYTAMGERAGAQLTGDELGSTKARGLDAIALRQLPWSLATTILPRPLLNLLFDVRFQLEAANVVIDERTDKERKAKKTTPNDPGTLRSWHQDSPQVLPSNGYDPKVGPPKAATPLHDHYTATSDSGSGSSITSPAKGPQGYAEYTGTGSNSEHNTKVVLDYVGKRVYLTLTHYQYWAIVPRDAGPTVWPSGTQSFVGAQGALAAALKKSGESHLLAGAVWMSPWMEVLMPGGGSGKKKPPEDKPPEDKAPDGKAPEGKAPDGKAPERKPPPPKAREQAADLVGGANNDERLSAFKTNDDGACGIHAMLGVVDPLTGRYDDAHAADVRGQIAARIREGNADAGRYRALLLQLLRAIQSKRSRGDALTRDEGTLWAGFSAIDGLEDALTSRATESRDRYAALNNRRGAIVDYYYDGISEGQATFGPLQQFLIGEILRSNAKGDAAVRARLESVEAGARAGVLEQVEEAYLRGCIENNLQGLAKRSWRAHTAMWWEYGEMRGASHRAGVRDATDFTALYDTYRLDLHDAYATAVETESYYLREEDLRELADIQGRGLQIYRQDDQDAGRFARVVNHPGANPFQVYHSGAHYEHAEHA